MTALQGIGTPSLTQPRFKTSDSGLCRDYIWDNTNTHSFDLTRASQLIGFVHHDYSVGRISVNWCDLMCTEGFRITKTRAAPYYAFQFIVRGTCRLEGAAGNAVVRAGEVFVLAPDQIQSELWSAHCQQFIVRIDREILERQLSEELARRPSKPVSFAPVGCDPGITDWLTQVADDLWNEGAESALIRRGRLARAIEQTLITMILTGLRHSESGDLAQQPYSTAPYYIKRAEAYIRDQVYRIPTVEDIAANAGVSARSLFYGFKQWRNTTPMAYVRNLRLDMAHKYLKKARLRGGTVSEAAVSAGFNNFSQFSKIYKARFGETPSATLRSG